MALLGKVLRRPLALSDIVPERAHILIVRSDHIGDLLLTVPFLRALRAKFPRAEIAFAATPLTVPILEQCPYIDKVVTSDYGDSSALASCVEELRSWGVDVAITLTQKGRDYKLCRDCGAPVRVGRASFSSLYTFMDVPTRTLQAFLLLTHIFPEYTKSILVKGQRLPHEIERQQRLSSLLGFPYTDTHLEMFFNASDREFGQQLRERWGQPWLVIHLHQKLLDCPIDTPETVWNEADLCSVLERIVAKAGDRKIALTYGPTEESLVARAKDILSRLNRSVETLEGDKSPQELSDSQLLFIGAQTLGKWGMVLGSGSCLISADTGAVHMAAAQGCPVIDIFPPGDFTRASQGFYPWQVPCAVLAKGSATATAEDIVRHLDFLAEGKL